MQADCARDITLRSQNGAAVLAKGWWAAACTAAALLVGIATVAAFYAHDVDQRSRPGDEQLTTNFFSHEAGFDELVQMLATDQARLAANGETSIDLATVARLTKNAARVRMYGDLLRQISVEDLRYFPDSGELVLVPDGQENPERPSRSYLYLPHGQSESLTRYHGYTWRGPGVSILNGDRPLTGSWLIHDHTRIDVAVAPY